MYQKNSSFSIHHGVAINMLNCRAISFCGSGRVDPTPQDVSTNSHTCALSMNKGKLGWWNCLQHLLPGAPGTQNSLVGRNQTHFVHHSQVNVNSTYQIKLEQ
jgi:hypothetical protein